MNGEAQTLSAFEQFLESIPLDRYREEPMPVKTVEQDLPPERRPIARRPGGLVDSPVVKYL